MKIGGPFDLGERARADVRVRFARESDAREGVKALQTALDFGRKGLAQQIKMLSKQKGTANIVGLLEDLLDAETGGVPGAEVGARLAQRPGDRVADVVRDL